MKAIHTRGGFTCLIVAVALFGVILLGFITGRVKADERAGQTHAYLYQQHINTNGINIEFRIASVEKSSRHTELREGTFVRFEFALSDAATGTPLSGVFPAAWMDIKRHMDNAGDTPEPEQCSDKVKRFVGGGLFSRAQLDLNVYYVLTMNDDASLTVVDPLFGFGGTKLLAMVRLYSPAQDWVLSADKQRIFASLPDSNMIAVIETDSWQVSTNIPTAASPARLALQPDGAYLWVGFEGADSAAAGKEVSAISPASGVAVIQPANLSERKRILTGRGRHDIAVSSDNRYVFVTNADDGTVSIIDIRRLSLHTTITTGPRPTSIAWAEMAQAVYVAHESSGEIVAIDATQHQIIGRMMTAPGVRHIRFEPSGRFGFAVNPETNLLYIIDSSKNRVVQTGPMADGPDQVSFSQTLAYVHHRDTEEVLMIPLDQVGQPGRPIPVIDFPGGTHPPGQAHKPTRASAIVKAPGANAVLVTNPTDGMVYYYTEGMAAPTGAFQNYGHSPRAVLVVDKSLTERRPGVYETSARLGRAGLYDLVFFLDAPRSTHCFALTVDTNPDLATLRAQLPLQIRAMTEAKVLTVKPDASVQLTLTVTDPKIGKPRAGLQDLEVMVMLAPGQWHTRHTARDLGDGTYAVSFQVPHAGLYYVYAACASEGIGLGQTRPLTYVLAADANQKGVE